MNESIITLNNRRHEAIARTRYNPLDNRIPSSMLEDKEYSAAMSEHDFTMLRFRHDFEFWAAKCVKIIDKVTKCSVPFILNRPQRRLLKAFEERRRAGVPLRFIVLKARQWGASTFVQIYFAWVQIMHLRNWHSLICAHVKDTAATIRGMYTHLLDNYPKEYWDEDSVAEFRPYERMNNVRVIPGRGCRVTVCSSENQESARGMDCSMAHLSEVAFWKDSQLHNPVDLIRSVTSGISRVPMTIVVMESTANGVGNFFHKEWQRAVDGKSDKTPFFVPWYEIDSYTEPVDDAEAFFASLSDYERELWDVHGCTLEAINWYRCKAREYSEHRSMMAEFPTTADEAFCATETSVFSAADVGRLRAEGCVLDPERGEVMGARGSVPADLSAPYFYPSPAGRAYVWQRPRREGNYIVSVDIGGRSRNADYSVITVIDRHNDMAAHDGNALMTVHCGDVIPAVDAVAGDKAGRPEVVAQWRGHIDHDLLAWKAAAMARWYNDALLVVESNSWECGSEGQGRYILAMLADSYCNLYYRQGEGLARMPGFHTNMRTKPMVINHMISLVREGLYIERDPDACDELLQYESQPGGVFAARRGCHDDILMSRAIALWIHAIEPAEAPRLSESDWAALLRQ